MRTENVQKIRTQTHAHTHRRQIKFENERRRKSQSVGKRSSCVCIIHSNFVSIVRRRKNSFSRSISHPMLMKCPNRIYGNYFVSLSFSLVRTSTCKREPFEKFTNVKSLGSRFANGLCFIQISNEKKGFHFFRGHTTFKTMKIGKCKSVKNFGGPITAFIPWSTHKRLLVSIHWCVVFFSFLLLFKICQNM